MRSDRYYDHHWTDEEREMKKERKCGNIVPVPLEARIVVKC